MSFYLIIRLLYVCHDKFKIDTTLYYCEDTYTTSSFQVISWPRLYVETGSVSTTISCTEHDNETVPCLHIYTLGIHGRYVVTYRPTTVGVNVQLDPYTALSDGSALVISPELPLPLHISYIYLLSISYYKPLNSLYSFFTKPASTN